MRIIKFRGKTPDGIWVYGQYAGEFDNSNVGGFRGALILAPYATIVEPLTVGQFTGLTDKEGNAIYEGDIILEKLKGERKDGELLEIVFGDFEWRVKNEVGCTTSLFFLNRYHEIEVIGNIHDNPELLKGGIK